MIMTTTTNNQQKDPVFLSSALECFFEYVSIDDARRVLKTLFDNQLMIVDATCTKEECFAIVKAVREITKLVNSVQEYYESGHNELDAAHHIKKLIRDHCVEEELDQVLYDWLNPSRMQSRGFKHYADAGELFYAIENILEMCNRVYKADLEKEAA